MSVRAHCEHLTKLLLALEADVHARLGYFPREFKTSMRGHVIGYFSEIERELADELAAVRIGIGDLRAGSSAARGASAGPDAPSNQDKREEEEHETHGEGEAAKRSAGAPPAGGAGKPRIRFAAPCALMA